MTSQHGRVGVRPATPEDAELLVDIVLESANNEAEKPISRRQLLKHPELSPYISGWQRDGDLGIIAVDLSGPAGLQIPVGSAWLRRYTVDHPGLAYISDDVPEVCAGVVAGHHGRGIEAALVRTLIKEAAKIGIRKLSAAARADSPSLEWLTAIGFQPITRAHDVHTLVADVTTVTSNDSGPRRGARRN